MSELVRCPICGDTFEAPRFLKVVEVVRTTEVKRGGVPLGLAKVRVAAVSCAGVLVHHCEEKPPCMHELSPPGHHPTMCIHCGILL